MKLFPICLLPAALALTALALHGADAVSPVPRAPVAFSPVLGAISSNKPIVISQITLSPTASPSWPVVEGDEIVARESSAFLVTAEKNRVVLDRGAVVNTRRVESGELYVYLRQGSLTFQVRSRKVYLCAANRLYVAKTSATGVLRMDPSGNVADHLNGGQFEERGKRPCNERGLLSLAAAPASGATAGAGSVGGVAAGSAAAAGGVAAGSAAVGGTAAGVAAGTASVGVAASTAAAGVAAGTAAAGAAVSGATLAIGAGAAAASATAVGVAASSLASGGTQSSTSSATSTPTTCTSGCNFVPPPLSGSLPL